MAVSSINICPCRHRSTLDQRPSPRLPRPVPIQFCHVLSVSTNSTAVPGRQVVLPSMYSPCRLLYYVLPARWFCRRCTHRCTLSLTDVLTARCRGGQGVHTAAAAGTGSSLQSLEATAAATDSYCTLRTVVQQPPKFAVAYTWLGCCSRCTTALRYKSHLVQRNDECMITVRLNFN